MSDFELTQPVSQFYGSCAPNPYISDSYMLPSHVSDSQFSGSNQPEDPFQYWRQLVEPESLSDNEHPNEVPSQFFLVDPESLSEFSDSQQPDEDYLSQVLDSDEEISDPVQPQQQGPAQPQGPVPAPYPHIIDWQESDPDFERSMGYYNPNPLDDFLFTAKCTCIDRRVCRGTVRVTSDECENGCEPICGPCLSILYEEHEHVEMAGPREDSPDTLGPRYIVLFQSCLFVLDAKAFQRRYPNVFWEPEPSLVNGNPEYFVRKIVLMPSSELPSDRRPEAQVFWWGYEQPTIEPYSNLFGNEMFKKALIQQYQDIKRQAECFPGLIQMPEIGVIS